MPGEATGFRNPGPELNSATAGSVGLDVSTAVLIHRKCNSVSRCQNI